MVVVSTMSDGRELRARGIAAALAVGADKPSDDESAASSLSEDRDLSRDAESDDESYVTDASKRMMSAMRADDPKAFKSALRDFLALVKE